jgi:hypothetical protein
MERLYGESAAVDKQQLPNMQQQQKHPQHNSTSPACGQTTTVTLAFKERDLEERFRSWYDDAATAHDAQVGGPAWECHAQAGTGGLPPHRSSRSRVQWLHSSDNHLKHAH